MIHVPIFNEEILDPNFFHDLGLESNFLSWSLIEKKTPSPWVSAGFDDSQAGKDIQFQELPAWDAFDRHVLRFTGYFKAGMSDVEIVFCVVQMDQCLRKRQESVVETNLENYRALRGGNFLGEILFYRIRKEEKTREKKRRHFLKKYFVLLGGMLVSYHQGVRKVTIYYYLEDDTCQIQEPKMDNSGMPQGALWV